MPRLNVSFMLQKCFSACILVSWVLKMLQPAKTYMLYSLPFLSCCHRKTTYIPASLSGHNGGTLEGPPSTSRYHTAVMFKGCPQWGIHDCRETLVSRTAICRSVCYSSRLTSLNPKQLSFIPELPIQCPYQRFFFQV